MALVFVKSSDEIGRELKSDDLLATIGQSLGQLEHAAHDIGIGSDRPLFLQENVTGGYLYHTCEFGKIHQFVGVERAAHTLVPYITALTELRYIGVMDVLPGRIHVVLAWRQRLFSTSYRSSRRTLHPLNFRVFAIAQRRA